MRYHITRMSDWQRLPAHDPPPPFLSMMSWCSWCSERNGQLMGSGVRVVVETPKRSEANNAAVAHGAPTSGTVKKDALPLCRCDILGSSDRRLSMSNKWQSNTFGAATSHTHTHIYIYTLKYAFVFVCRPQSSAHRSTYHGWVKGGGECLPSQCQNVLGVVSALTL